MCLFACPKMQKALRTTPFQSQGRSLQARPQRGYVAPRAQLPSTENAAQKEQPTLTIATFLASSLLAVASVTPALANEEVMSTLSAPTADLNTIVAEGVELSISTQAQAIEVFIPEAAPVESSAIATATPSALSDTADMGIPSEQALIIPDSAILTGPESAPVLEAAISAEEPFVAAAAAANSSESSASANDETIATTPLAGTPFAPEDAPVDTQPAFSEAVPDVPVEDAMVDAVTPVDLVIGESAAPEAVAQEVAVEAAPVVVEAAEAAAVPTLEEDEVPAAAAAAAAVEEEVTPEMPVAASLDDAVELPAILAADIEGPDQSLALPELVDIVPVVTDAATEAAPISVPAATAAAENAVSADASFDLPALFAAAAAAISGASSATGSGAASSEVTSAETFTYGLLGAAAASFVGTFFVAPRFKESFKEPVDWRDMYAALVAKGVKTVTVEEAYAKAKKGAVLLDVRLASKFDSLSAAPSINVPLYQPIAGWDVPSTIRRVGFAFFGIFGTELNANFLSEVAAKVPKNKEVIVMCESGGTIENKPGTQFGFQSRSLKAVYYLQQAGFSKVLHLKGGLGDWQRAGLPTNDGVSDSSAGSSITGRGTNTGNGKGTVAGKASTTASKATARELISATSSRNRK